MPEVGFGFPILAVVTRCIEIVLYLWNHISNNNHIAARIVYTCQNRKYEFFPKGYRYK
jgi:hypothetical protein